MILRGRKNQTLAICLSRFAHIVSLREKYLATLSSFCIGSVIVWISAILLVLRIRHDDPLYGKKIDVSSRIVCFINPIRQMTLRKLGRKAEMR